MYAKGLKGRPFAVISKRIVRRLKSRNHPQQCQTTSRCTAAAGQFRTVGPSGLLRVVFAEDLARWARLFERMALQAVRNKPDLHSLPDQRSIHSNSPAHRAGKPQLNVRKRPVGPTIRRHFQSDRTSVEISQSPTTMPNNITMYGGGRTIPNGRPFRPFTCCVCRGPGPMGQAIRMVGPLVRNTEDSLPVKRNAFYGF